MREITCDKSNNNTRVVMHKIISVKMIKFFANLKNLKIIVQIKT